MIKAQKAYSGFADVSDRYLNTQDKRLSMVFRGKTEDDWVSAWKDLAPEKSSSWIFSKQIVIYKDDAVTDSIVDPIVSGITEMVDDIGLDFLVKYKELDESAKLQLDLSKNYVSNQNIFDSRLLWRLLRYEEHTSPENNFAKVFITPYELKEKAHWGESQMSSRYAIFGATKERLSFPNSDAFWNKLAKHEASHLLGYTVHHNEYLVDGYTHSKDCTCMPSASSKKTCPKCLDALVSMWEGVEQRTGEKFFR